MESTLVVESWLMEGSARFPVTPKIVTFFRILLLTRFASPLMVCAPAKYWPDWIVWSLVPGV